MRTRIRKQNGISIVELSGKIVGPSALELRNVLLAEIESSDAPRILLNFKHVHMIGSSGLGVLITVHAVVKRNNGRIGVVCVGKHIKNLIVVSRIVRLFEHFGDEATAVSVLSV